MDSDKQYSGAVVSGHGSVYKKAVVMGSDSQGKAQGMGNRGNSQLPGAMKAKKDFEDSRHKFSTVRRAKASRFNGMIGRLGSIAQDMRTAVNDYELPEDA